MQLQSANLQDYLAETEQVNYSDRAVARLAAAMRRDAADEAEFVRAAFEYVRDRIAHSWDIQSPRITARASEVLRYGEGICYAKSMLLAALLRAQGVPAGFCYQRLTLGDTPDTGYCIHALNAVYLTETGKWIRLDARGNKPGIQAEFSLDEERLAFPIREYCGEIDYPTVFVSPHPVTVDVLQRSTNALEMYAHGLPASLEDGGGAGA